MLTPFGKKIRKLRIDKEVKLKDMAIFLKVTPAFLSALENGKKNISSNLLDLVVCYFGLNNEATKELKKDAEDSKTSIKFSLQDKSSQERELVTAFARKFSDLKPLDIDKIKKILEKG